MLERQGFMPEPWSTLQMRRPLTTPIPAPQVPDGYTLRPLADESEIAAVAALHQEVFDTSAGVGAERLAMMRDPEYLPELDLVVVAPDGTLAAFGLGAISYADDWCRGSKAGWVELIGTRPAFRQLREAGERAARTGILIALPKYFDAAAAQVLQQEMNQKSALQYDVMHRRGERRVWVQLR